MLKGISPIISPALLENLASMGHGDWIMIGDCNYPCSGTNNNVVRADGVNATDLLNAIMEIMPLDFTEDEGANVILMGSSDPEAADPKIWTKFKEVVENYETDVEYKSVNRFEFYDLAYEAFVAVQSSETLPYGCILLRKGCL